MLLISTLFLLPCMVFKIMGHFLGLSITLSFCILIFFLIPAYYVDQLYVFLSLNDMSPIVYAILY